MRLGHDRLAELELVLALGVEQAPGGADRAFLARLPVLVEGLDDVVVELLALGDGAEGREVAHLLDPAGPRVGAHAAVARPAGLADHDLLVGKARLDLLVDVDDVLLDAGLPVGLAAIEPDRLVLPVGQDVDGDEIDLVGERRVAQPEFPDIGIGHGLRHALLDLADVAPQLVGRQVLAQQHLVADDHPLDRVLVLVGMIDQQVDLLEVFLLVVVEPGAVPDLQPVLAGTLRHRLEILARGIGPHGPHLALQAVQIVVDLVGRREGAGERALAGPVRRERHALQRRGRPAGDLHRPVGPRPPQEIERRHGHECEQRHQSTHGKGF